MIMLTLMIVMMRKCDEYNVDHDVSGDDKGHDDDAYNDYGNSDDEVSLPNPIVISIVISILIIHYQPRQYIHVSNRLPPVPRKLGNNLYLVSKFSNRSLCSRL